MDKVMNLCEVDLMDFPSFHPASNLIVVAENPCPIFVNISRRAALLGPELEENKSNGYLLSCLIEAGSGGAVFQYLFKYFSTFNSI